MSNVLDSNDHEANQIHQKLLHLRRVEYPIYFLNGLAFFLFLISCTFESAHIYLRTYFYAGTGIMLFISQFQLLYIYFWRKNFKKYQHSNHGFQAYNWALKTIRILLLFLGLILMISSISIFVSYRLYLLITEPSSSLFIMSVVALDFFILSVLYLYYNSETKWLSDYKPTSKK
jgi:hypothetical protein